MEPDETPQGIEAQGELAHVAEVTEPESTGGINPAWNPVLELLPESFHKVVTPQFQQWDKNYQDGIQKVHSQYADWKPFVDQGVSAENVQYALQVLDAIQQRPQEVIQALQEYFPPEVAQQVAQELTEEQGQQNPSFDINSIPELQKMQEMVTAMAQIMVQQQEESKTSAESQKYEQQAQAIVTANNGREFDKAWVYGQMLNNDKLSLAEAAKMYYSWEDGIKQTLVKPGPTVIGAGGAAPQTSVQPKNLDAAGRKALAIQIMQNAQQASG